jgi:hypothetical protein
MFVTVPEKFAVKIVPQSLPSILTLLAVELFSLPNVGSTMIGYAALSRKSWGTTILRIPFSGFTLGSKSHHTQFSFASNALGLNMWPNFPDLYSLPLLVL